MNPSIQAALTDQANHELYAAHAYRAMAIWCDDQDYNGFAKFFFTQAAEELEHADKFIRHLLDRGVMPKLTALEAPTVEFTKLIEVAQLAETLEQRNSANIHQCYAIAQEVQDFASFPLLLSLIEEQVEEESWAATMLTLTKRAECSGAIYNLDRHIVKELSATNAA
ncbi:ferritin [Coraliomargarita algicola]|uniref:Ferritin n=1 Tax=Coraliomargarita algicola TaxID=3092156 RepID=A0ABZ0RR75_9BACT|nr:ferritin [Coraliomargarita sp. J2-16]WPJ97598.1 ferritin [Coraliomargarita sp. J2-16]